MLSYDIDLCYKTTKENIYDTLILFHLLNYNVHTLSKIVTQIFGN